MQINFVSLFDAIRAIAPRIDVSEQDVDFYSAPPAGDGPLWEMLARRPARQCFQESRAAIQLLDCLFNTSVAPRWFDVAQTGFPLQSEDARKEGRDALVRLANQEQLFKDQVELSRRLSPRWRDELPATNRTQVLALNLPRLHRSFSIGLERSELSELLDKAGIPHNPFSLAKDDVASNENADGENDTLTPPGIPTPELAAAFANLGGWDEARWLKNLPQSPWARQAQVRAGRRGKGGAAEWDPVRLAQLASTKRNITLDDWARTFRRQKSLRPWLEGWKEYEEQERWYGDAKNPLSKP